MLHPVGWFCCWIHNAFMQQPCSQRPPAFMEPELTLCKLWNPAGFIVLSHSSSPVYGRRSLCCLWCFWILNSPDFSALCSAFIYNIAIMLWDFATFIYTWKCNFIYIARSEILVKAYENTAWYNKIKPILLLQSKVIQNRNEDPEAYKN